MYPHGWHPVHPHRSRNAAGMAQHWDRIDVGVKYFFIDFGLSSCFAPGQQRLVYDILGRERRPPELQGDIPYDPFRIDVAIMGYLMISHARYFVDLIV
jgi:hypothetical protein